jgi:hypothetical protein
MPQPLKPDHLRQRRNRTSTKALLPPEADTAGSAVPELPPIGDGKDGEQWHPLVRRWWKSVWTSPMASEYLAADKDALYMLARLHQDFWMADTGTQRQQLAAEIRQQGVRFGLSPIDRRRLQWEVEKGDQAAERTTTRRERKNASGKDPRDVLKVVG